MDRNRVPLYEALIDHHKKNAANFHVPGHKGGQGADLIAAAFLQPAMRLDYTEIDGLDDLHQPEGVIAEAQNLAADCFGAEETHFLIGGSTAGNLAAIYALCRPEDIVLVQRNAHKSILNGLILSGAKAVFLPPQTDEPSGLLTVPSVETVQEALNRFPNAKAVVLTNPNYYGMAASLRRIADLAHLRAIPLVVDEAHGAHFGFHPALPPSALQEGADLVVQSTHKMLTSMTMTAMLHMQGPLVDREAVKRALTMLQSSSPSYPLMASLDLARMRVYVEGAGLFDRGLEMVRAFRVRIEAELPSYGMIKPWSPMHAYTALDPFKVTLWDRTGTLSGFQLQKELQDRGIYAEMADPKHVLLVFSLATNPSEADKLFYALHDLEKQFGLSGKENRDLTANRVYIPRFPAFFEPIRLIRQPESSKTRLIPLHQAAGQRSAGTVIPYPPGIPLLFPGETISNEAVDYLKQLSAEGARFHGDYRPDRQAVLVLAE